MKNLALLGGPPVRTAPWPTWPVCDESDLAAVEAVLRSGRWGGNFRTDPTFEVEKFAQEFAGFHGARYGIPCMNGTIALEVALAAAGIGFGDEVIVPATTFVATATAVLFVDALPVFADIDPHTLCISPAEVERLITPATKAIIPVHLGGVMADLDALLEICQKHDLLLIQDAAHAQGCEWRGQGLGAYGDMACFSFQNLKLVTSGEGGMILTNSQAFMEACRVYINCGRVHASFQFAQPMIGSNLRLPEIQGALLRTQFARYPSQLETRIQNAAHLTEGFSQMDGLHPISGPAQQTRNPYYRYGFLYDPSAFCGVPRHVFVKAAQAEGIVLQPEGGQPMYRSPLFPWETSRWKRIYGDRLDYSQVSTPVSEKTTAETACRIPHEILLGSPADMDDILAAVRKIQIHAEELKSVDFPPDLITSA